MTHLTTRGIVTTYNGVTFRSLLEARYACLFDMMGVRWDYEPITLGDDKEHGSGYIPDFLVHTPIYEPDPDREQTPVLVEVRPLINKQEYRDPINKIARSGWRGPAMVLGATTIIRDHAPPSELPPEYYLGYATHATKAQHEDPKQIAWNPVGWSDTHGRFALFSTFDIRPMWRAAGARVQWQPRS